MQYFARVIDVCIFDAKRRNFSCRATVNAMAFAAAIFASISACSDGCHKIVSQMVKMSKLKSMRFPA